LADPVDPLFLSVEGVVQIHNKVSGAEILDLDHLESAVKGVEHFPVYADRSDLFDIAAAYAFHICEAHPFLDGNKRTALVACLAFLSSTESIPPVTRTIGRYLR
jgi:death on curing protein